MLYKLNLLKILKDTKKDFVLSCIKMNLFEYYLQEIKKSIFS